MREADRIAETVSRAFAVADAGFRACPDPAACPPLPAKPGGRTKLWHLPSQLFCSIIGTCLGTAELRKLVARCSHSDIDSLSDLAVHELAVQLAGRAERGGRTLHRALDDRHETTVKRFDRAKTTVELGALWEDAKRSGDIAGAYWAVLTHRTTTPELRYLAFGDVHMLSHLVGAANRADIRRLAALEARNTELEGKVEKQQSQLRDAIVARDESIKRLADQLAVQIARSEDRASVRPCEATGELQTLHELVASLRRRLESETARRERAERRAEVELAELAEAQVALRIARNTEQSMRAELDAAEAELLSLRGSDGVASDCLQRAVRGCTVLYVGGRPKQTQAIRNIIEQAHGEFVHHDGGLEDRKGLLASEVHRADIVFFPVDCVSHDAAAVLKRTCQQAAKPYRPLRTTSVASFIAGLYAHTWTTSPIDEG